LAVSGTRNASARLAASTDQSVGEGEPLGTSYAVIVKAAS
jgi:hypothetical protein